MTRRVQRVLLGLAAVVALGAAGALLVGFVLPDAYPPADFVNLGSADGYPVGSVTRHEDVVDFTEGRWALPVPVDLRGGSRLTRPVAIILTRLEDGSFRAFLGRDPRSGCEVRWRPELDPFNGYTGGVLREGCHGSTYSRAGEGIFGPSPWNLDAFDVAVTDSGDVVVEVRELHRSTRPSRWQSSDATPLPTATPAPGPPR